MVLRPIFMSVLLSFIWVDLLCLSLTKTAFAWVLLFFFPIQFRVSTSVELTERLHGKCHVENSSLIPFSSSACGLFFLAGKAHILEVGGGWTCLGTTDLCCTEFRKGGCENWKYLFQHNSFWNHSDIKGCWLVCYSFVEYFLLSFLPPVTKVIPRLLTLEAPSFFLLTVMPCTRLCSNESKVL